MRSALLHTTLAVALLASCNNTDDIAPTTLNFTRPIDISFACYGALRITGGGSANAAQPIVNQAQPVEACNIRSTLGSDQQTTLIPPGQGAGSGSNGFPAISNQNVSWYAFILQSVPGTLGLATFNTKATFTGVNDVTVLDADPFSPGKTGITMGIQPIGVITDAVGCYEVTANAGTCDLSALDITSALNYQADPATALGSNQPVRVDSLAVTDGHGMPVRAKPAAIVSQPATGTIGAMCPATPTGIAYVAYPSCHVVAGIDLSDGTVVAGIQLDTNGMPTIMQPGSDGKIALACPDECSGGGTITDGARPTSLDLQLDESTGRRTLAIGAENSNVVTIVDLDINSHPASTSTVALENTTGSLGVNQVKVSPTIGMGGVDGQGINDSATAPGGLMQFLYAITSDATVRVANIHNSVNQECDTQVDPRYLRDKGAADIGFMSCMPVGGSNTPPRRATAIGPGIQLINRMPAITTTSTTTSITSGTSTSTVGGTAEFTVPMGIDIFHVTDPQVVGATPPAAAPTTLYGYFAIITGANGQTYILDIDDDNQADYVGENSTNPIGTAIPYDIANQLRDSLPGRDLIAEEGSGSNSEVAICETDGPDPDSTGGNSGGPRSAGTTTITLPSNPSVFASTKEGLLPSIQGVQCIGADTPGGFAGSGIAVSELSFPAPISVRDAAYPDVMGMIADENWSLTYEGSLSIDSNVTASNGPANRTGVLSVDGTGMYLTDQDQPFCAAGVEPYDILQVSGCDPTQGNADCPPNYTCFVHPQSTVTGVGECVLTSEADTIADICKEFLISDRTYTIGKTSTGQLKLLERKHVLRTSPIDGCTSDAQCQVLADYALANTSPNNPIDNKTGSDPHTWGCMEDPLRAPDLDGSGNLIKRCIEECGSDTDCDAGTVCKNGLCMEGIEPAQACINAPEHYQLDAGEAFVVAGTLSGFHSDLIADGSGNCVQDPNGSPFDIGRLPLQAPACDPSANALGILPDGTVEANPCETTVSQWEYDNTYQPGTCTVTGTPLVERQADAIVFRGPAFNLTLVDPTYPGDAACIGDRGGNLGRIPIVPRGTSIALRITGGFRPQFLAIQPALPGKVVRGPTQSIWVIDQGDYISQSYDVASTSGKVFRIESGALGVINVLE